jgi:hypothetical protein
MEANVPEAKKKEAKNPIRLSRNDKGEVRPIKGVSPNLGIEVEVIPLTYGASRKIESFGEALFEWSDEDKIAVLNEHIHFPPMEIRDVKDLHESFDAWAIEDLMQAVFLYSGMGRLFVQDEETEGNVEGEAEEES